MKMSLNAIHAVMIVTLIGATTRPVAAQDDSLGTRVEARFESLLRAWNARVAGGSQSIL